MYRFWIFLFRIPPCLEDFEHEEVIFIDQSSIDHLALKVGETLREQGRPDTLGGQLFEPECLELVGVTSRTIADSDDLGRQRDSRDADHALASRAQSAKAVIPLTYDASHLGRGEFDHHVPRHGHYVGPTLVFGDKQHHRPRFEQPVDLFKR
jgi:hypothetical protein